MEFLAAGETRVFRGVSNLNLDAKGRMAMPTKYRERLIESCGGRLVITLDRDGCLLLYPQPEWERIEIELMKLPSLNKQARGLQRLLLGHATECEFDGQGRILLPAPLRKVCDLNKEVVLIGQGNKFELWNEQAWGDRREQWLQEESVSDEVSAALTTLSL